MNPPITDRQSRIIELLTGRSRPLAIPEVAERLGCSERTVQRDIEALRRASVEIATEPGRAGGLLLKRPVAATIQPAPALAPLPGNEFVGRSGESAQLDQLLDAAMSGRGCVAMILGEPGIGKTRTVRELSTRARSARRTHGVGPL